jgi:rare lipoprotein A
LLYSGQIMPRSPILKGMRRLLPLIMLVVSTVLWADPEMEGLASWYGGKFHGRLTSSGEVFDTNTLTAAHKSLPFGTLVKVTNLDNSLSTLVKINDRGPFVEGRIIDLSRAAADEIGMLGQGVARVSLEIVAFAATDKDIYAIQVGAYGLEANAERAKLTLESAGLFVTIEKTGLNVARVLVRGVPAPLLAETRRKLESLGFLQYLLRKEKTEAPAQAAAQAAAPGRTVSLHVAGPAAPPPSVP